METERRTYTITDFRVEKREDKPPKIIGHAAVFDNLSEEIFGFREKIAPGAFKKTLKDDDVRALFNHDPNIVLGRNGSGTLTLSEDNKGLAVEIDPPDTQQARDLMVSIERGDISQMSFAFRAMEEEWKFNEGKDPDIRTLKEVKLFDVSPVTFPAYTETDVGVRSLCDIASNARKIQEEKEQETAFKVPIELNKRKQALAEVL